MIDKIAFIREMSDLYSAGPHYLWEDAPDYAVFRHGDDGKWFAILMPVRRDRLGLPGEGTVDTVNVKCEPYFPDTLIADGIGRPAYHMNKTHWISLPLDGSVPDDLFFALVQKSFELTAPKIRKAKFKTSE